MSTTSVQQQITAAANAAGVPPSLALAVAQQESGFNQNARGQAGEIGIFQVMPTTAPGVNLSDPTTNINTGVSLLAKYYQQYGGDTASVLTAYNAGPGAVGNPPSSTQNYIASVENLQSQFAGADSSTASTLANDNTDDTGDGSSSPGFFDSLAADLASGDNTPYYVAGAAAIGLMALWAFSRG
jgi:hypothetical protein